MTTGSMRSRLMRLQWLALLLAGAVSGILSFALTWHTVNDLRDHTLEQVAQSVVRHGLEVEGDDTDPDVPDQGQFTSQIWTQDGKLYYASTPDDGPPRQRPGWHRLSWQQQEWHVYTLEQDGLTIQVSQPSQSRNQAFWRVAPVLALALLVVTAGLYFLLHLAASTSLKPLGQLRQVLDQADPRAPQSSLSDRPWPSELQPLVATLTQLFERLAEARLAQQHLVTRAAHGFRTPLAALKIHAQLLGRHTAAESPQEGRHREHLLLATDRMTRLVDQLLQLAEFDAMGTLPAAQALDVVPWLEPYLRLWQALAKAHHIELDVDLPPQARLWADGSALGAALDNVVHNAIRHSPSGGRIELSLMTEDGHGVWRVQDHGPGMSEADRARAGEVFASLPRTHPEGSGLGLAIARRVAELHAGTLQLLPTPGGGLTVELRLAQAPSTATPR